MGETALYWVGQKVRLGQPNTWQTGSIRKYFNSLCFVSLTQLCTFSFTPPQCIFILPNHILVIRFYFFFPFVTW